MAKKNRKGDKKASSAGSAYPYQAARPAGPQNVAEPAAGPGTPLAQRWDAAYPQAANSSELSQQDDPPKLDQEQGSLYTWDDALLSSWLPYGDGTASVFGADEWLSRDYEQMLKRDGKARAIEQVLTLPIKSASWKLIPGKGDTGEAAFVEEALTAPANMGGMQTPMRLVISQALSARTYKRACFEKVFTEKDGKIVYKKLAFRPASTAEIIRDNKTGAFRGIMQRPVPIGGTYSIPGAPWVVIPAQYSWVHLNNQHINAANGHSDMELIFWLHNQKNKIWLLWATFLENQAAGRYVVTAQDENTAAKYVRAIRAMKGGGVFGTSGEIPPTIDTLEVSGEAAALFQKFLDYCDQQMAESVLAMFLNLGGSNRTHGSLALSRDQSDFFLQSLTATARELEESITNYVVADLVRLNFGEKGVCPKFEFGELSERDLESIQAMLIGFANAQNDPRVPQAFINELCLSAAKYLDLPLEEIESQMDELEARLKELSDLNLKGKKQGLELQAQAAAQGGPVAGAAARKNSAEIMGQGNKVAKNTQAAKVNGIATMVKQKQAAEATKQVTGQANNPKPTT